ncbi:helix-turn-helix transcriptional regulator [Mannheimia indoligenes]|uniref:helix-turn-helix domain-containing protein n=1 Tax=Mannheimia indoligenes TaxID=3103145 RepID=UPI002FE5C0BA
MCISNRLKQVLEAKNMTVTEFSNVTGISYRSAMNYLNEGRDPNVEALIKIHQAFGVSITWLLTGNRAMFQAVNQESNMSSQEEKLIANYRAMPENLKEAFAISFKEISDNL